MIDSFRGEHRFLSNFYPCHVRYLLTSYRSAEHAYQASKTNRPMERRRIRHATTPSLAKRLGRQATLREGWDKTKVGVMHAIVKAKFAQNPELRQRLLATENEQLVEGNWWGDTFWGVCHGEGENHLGCILMQVRKELQ